MNAPAAQLSPTAATRRVSIPDSASYTDCEDADLVKRFNAGEDGAFVEITHRYRSRLSGVAFRMLKNHADAEEIAQDTFVRAYRALPLFRGDSSLSTWLHRIALNLARNRYWYFFRHQRHNTVSLDCSLTEDGAMTFANLVAADASGPDREAVTEEFSVLIAECIERMDAPARTMLMLRNTSNLSYEEIAGRLGLNIGTVKSRLARARNRLRELLAETCPEFANDAPPIAWFEPMRPAGGLATVCA